MFLVHFCQCISTLVKYFLPFASLFLFNFGISFFVQPYLSILCLDYYSFYFSFLKANAAKEMLVPYFPPVIESLKVFLTDTRDEMRSLQTQALGKEIIYNFSCLLCNEIVMRIAHSPSLSSPLYPDTLSVLARTVGKDVFGPLAAECVQLGLKLTDAVDDPDLRRCTYG